MHPTLKRLKKVTTATTILEWILCFIVGVGSYICLGDLRTPKILFLRNTDTLENSILNYIILGLVMIFFVVLTAALPLYNPSVREYLTDQFQTKSSFYFYFFSILPLIVVIIISIAFPQITKILEIFGLSIYCYDAYILPSMMQFSILKDKPKNAFYYQTFIVMMFMVTICTVGIIYEIYSFF